MRERRIAKYNDATPSCTGGPEIAHIIYSENKQVIYVEDVWVDPRHRGNGLASEMLQELTEWADRNGQRATLTIDPRGDGLTADQLREWYGRYGFAARNSTSLRMVREPQ